MRMQTEAIKGVEESLWNLRQKLVHELCELDLEIPCRTNEYQINSLREYRDAILAFTRSLEDLRDIWLEDVEETYADSRGIIIRDFRNLRFGSYEGKGEYQLEQLLFLLNKIGLSQAASLCKQHGIYADPDQSQLFVSTECHCSRDRVHAESCDGTEFYIYTAIGQKTIQTLLNRLDTAVKESYKEEVFDPDFSF